MEIRQRSFENSTQNSFELPHQVLTSTTYSDSPENGTTYLIYGHDSGIRIFWLSTASTTSADISEYDDEDGNRRLLPPFADIPLDAAAVHLSTPIASPSSELASLRPIGRYLSDHIVVAVACSDNSIYLVTCSTKPPVNDAAPDELSISLVSEASAHAGLISSLSLTWTVLGNGDTEAESARSQSSNRGADKRNVVPGDLTVDECAFLLASTSPTGSGLLLVHSVAVTEQASTSDDLRGVKILKQSLGLPVSGCTIQFNPTPYPSPKHTTLLVTVPSQGLIRILDVSGQRANAGRHRQRIESSDSHITSAPLHLTLRTGYAKDPTKGALPRRKRVLDAAWIVHGGAILVLLECGQWGIWDIDALGPSSNVGSKGLIKGDSNVSSINGGGITRFTLCGTLSTSPIATATTRRNIDARMVPKNQQDPEIRYAKQGKINVSAINATSAYQRPLQHVVLYYDGQIYFIFDIDSFLQTEVQLKPVNSSRIQRLSANVTGHDIVTSVVALPQSTNVETGGYLGVTPPIPDLVICKEHRIVMMNRQAKSKVPVSSKATALSLRPSSNTRMISSLNPVNKRVLDIHAIDEALEGMNVLQKSRPTSSEDESVPLDVHHENRQDQKVHSAFKTRGSRSKLNITNRDHGQQLFR